MHLYIYIYLYFLKLEQTKKRIRISNYLFKRDMKDMSLQYDLLFIILRQ